MTGLAWLATYISAAALIACAFLLGHWYRGWTQRAEREAAYDRGHDAGVAAGRAAYAKQIEAAWRPVHAVHADYVARTRQFTASAFADNGGIR